MNDNNDFLNDFDDDEYYFKNQNSYRGGSFFGGFGVFYLGIAILLFLSDLFK